MSIMTEIVNLALRDGSRVYEDVDLDQLTPRARTVAEVIARTTLRTPVSILLRSDRGEMQSWRGWDGYPVNSPVTPLLWLENAARRIPMGWHVYGVGIDHPVPSVDAGADDTRLSRYAAITYMQRRGSNINPAAWDTLCGTGHLPEPDRYVNNRPQWRPAAIDAYLTRPRDLWTVSQIATYLGYQGDPSSAASSARRQLGRWGFTAEGRAPGRGGESLYPADQIIAAHTHRPGKGNRTPR
ncbi:MULTISPECIES: hypothetical protein [Streptomyces]|uniref:Uncharacterized protein n=1 Tax=Streptomyces uncialis TaxID=1048205 RepID=A0A1Q4V126_9ACTN|nr:hypothetical protein [Streptomyces uncialis]OKH91517.1 hypothetical protein AB852_28595 [Streptomyces uncialis]